MWRPEVALVPMPTTCISTVPAADIRAVTVPTIGAPASEVKTGPTGTPFTNTCAPPVLDGSVGNNKGPARFPVTPIPNKGTCTEHATSLPTGTEFFHKYLPIPLFIKLYDELY